MSNVVLDTNLLVYIKDISSVHHKAAFHFLSTAHAFFTTSKSLAEYYAVVTKGPVPLLTPQEALEDLEEFASAFTILYPNERSWQKLRDLISVYQPKGLKIHDFEIAAISISCGINKIATYNRQDFKNINEIEIIEP